MSKVVIAIVLLLGIVLIKRLPVIGGNIHIALLIAGAATMICSGIFTPGDWILAFIDGMNRIAWITCLALTGGIFAEISNELGTVDTIIGVFSSTAIALGLVLMSYSSSLSKFSSYLVGDLLSITGSEILLLILVFIAVIILWYFIFNKLLITSLNTSLANSRGINTLLIEILFTCTIAVVVTLTVSWVGLLIINSLLVLPGASARNIAKNVRQYHLFSIVIALFSGITGLILSYYLNTVTGATIVLVSSVVFFITLILKKKFI